MTISEACATIRAVERDTGLATDTLRIWERRYGFPCPLRDSTGERLYPADQVQRLRLVKRLLDQGHRPGKLLGASAEQLAALLAETGSPADREDDRCPLMGFLRENRFEALQDALRLRLVARGLPAFIVEVAAPMNDAVGAAWFAGEIGVHQEHLYTELMQTVLRSAIFSAAQGARPPRVLLATLPEEEHGLGLLMVHAMLTAEGALCIPLGPRVPVADVEQAAVLTGADLVALSFSRAFPARRAAAGVAALRGALPRCIPLWVGGRGVPDKLRDVVGVHLLDLDAIPAAVRAWRADGP